MSASNIYAQLAHDVGKYIARTARNLPPSGPIPSVLVGMMAKDFYLTDGQQRASAVFDAVARPLTDDRLDKVRGYLATIDALEAAVRQGDDMALRQGAALALEIERALRTLAKDGGA